jgi:hypothetical protein
MKLNLFTLVATTAIFSNQVAAKGYIGCKSVYLNGAVGHTAYYSFDNGQSFYCSAQTDDCSEMRGVAAYEKQYVSCPGNDDGHESAAFWITSDGCYNIESGT